jgi:heme-degrading monooxygenase HmoA
MSAMNANFASLPEPPYYAVIFSSLRNDQDEAGYAAAADRMLALAAEQPGFLGAESTRGTDGFGITVSYWVSEAAISAWKRQAEHAATRKHGRTHWYAHFELRVARVERAYGKPTRG